ncbi:type II secretion system F family protein [Alteribacter natronophilus]|uniref:type II secretion system F family protein n=1 Tax=Alteribacter natronophilus TaxID=2583810 RepID=UPI00110D2A69|nr:type II secretion system F family protein [Alteribacter natronophilus]TMW70678.1 type II secretion system F family protein [Alteribacter natronophilus]
MEILIAFLVFILISALLFPSRAVRAMMMRKRLLAPAEGERVKRKGILESATPAVTAGMTLLNVRISHERREEIAGRLQRAGYEEKMSVDHFYTFKVLCALAGGGYFAILGLNNPAMFFLALVTPLLAFGLPDFWLKQRMKSRQDRIRRELPYILNSISILCDAGMNLFASIREVAQTKDGELPKELERVIKQVGMGVSQAQALENMSLRCQVDEVSRFVSAVTQTIERGSAGLTAVLRHQAAEVWESRKKKAQQLGEQASLKLFFPLVLLAFPALAIFILGPVAMNVLDFIRG